jgi:hypothetical protein
MMERDEVAKIARTVFGQTAILPMAQLEMFSAMVERATREKLRDQTERLAEELWGGTRKWAAEIAKSEKFESAYHQAWEIIELLIGGMK